ncbi:SpoIIE family protein phosphatase [Streptomyces sp. YPW6]|uniref:SpoIIE family protein phosphatase n=1 Tax=Streptomyces sp. YPW6 TaxID=2840373 RepID=UPI003D72925A
MGRAGSAGRRGGRPKAGPAPTDDGRGTAHRRDAVPAGTFRTLGVGDRILFYTDGLSEARDTEGAFYPVLQRAAPLLRDGRPEDALNRLRADVAVFTGKAPDDDSALLLIEVRGPLAAPAGGV